MKDDSAVTQRHRKEQEQITAKSIRTVSIPKLYGLQEVNKVRLPDCVDSLQKLRQRTISSESVNWKSNK